MTANQRRPGFRLPWSSEDEDASAAAPNAVAPRQDPTPGASPTGSSPAEDAKPAETAPTQAPEEAAPASAEKAPAPPAADPSAPDTVAPVTPAEPTPVAHRAADTDAPPDFMRDLVSAMRGVADEARQAGISDARAAADEQVKRLESDAEERRNELRARADADVAGIGEWAKAEAERIRKEAEQRVVARREQLDQELGAETARAESQAKVLRERVGEYERELDAYHAQLAEINDPAAFAAAAKRMPRPPALEPRSGSAPAAPSSPSAATTAAVATPTGESAAETNGVAPSPEVHPAEEEVLASRLAELDAELPDAAAGAASEAASPTGEPTATEIVVSGLGSFGAITGFRQALAGVTGVEGVALSLGQTGEFIFRATHRVGFDVAGAITGLEGDGATVETRPDGSLHVTLDRPR